MKKSSLRAYIPFSAFCVVGALIIRLIGLLTDLRVLNAVYAVLLLIGSALIVFRRIRLYPSRFGADAERTNKNIRLFSSLAAACFFVRFLSQSVLLFRGITGRRTEGYFIAAIGVSTVLSLLCCVYFIAVALTYSRRNYDFKELYFFHLVPLFWSLSEIFSVIAGAGEFDRDIDSLLKYSALVALTLFFFFFARELDGDENAGRFSAVFSGLCTYLPLMFFADRLLMLIASEAQASSPDNVLALTGLALSCFAFSYRGTAEPVL